MEAPQAGEEEQIILRCHEVPPELLIMLQKLKNKDIRFNATLDGETHRLYPASIFYVEAVDNKSFLYCHEAVYESRQKLYELEEDLLSFDFLRISKSFIVNLREIKSLAPAFSGRLEATLENGEKLIISRQYVSALKKKLGM